VDSPRLYLLPNPGSIRRFGYKRRRRIFPTPDFQSRPEHGKWPSGMNHHPDRGSDSDFNDPGGRNKASYFDDPIDSIEPLPDISNPYRAAAIYHLQLMFAVDEFITAAPDARLAVVAVSVVLQWPSTRGMTAASIAEQLGVSAATVIRACTKFREISGLGASASGVRFFGPVPG
jgi:hypothetical protein